MKINPENLDFRESHHLLAGSIVPRPILLISTIGEDGVFNVAPFSFVTGVSLKPTLIGFEISTRRDGRKKDTINNIERTKEFVVNVVTEDMVEAMNLASADYPSDVDEFKESGLTPVKGDIVKVPRVAESPISFECRLIKILEFGLIPTLSSFVIGEVVLAHIRDGLYVRDDIVSPDLKAIGRLGSELYCRTCDVFKMERS